MRRAGLGTFAAVVAAVVTVASAAPGSAEPTPDAAPGPTAVPAAPAGTPTVDPSAVPSPPPPPDPYVAEVTSASASVTTARFPVYDAGGRKIREALWRVTDAGGSCCGTYVAATPGGRLLELGGTHPTFSDDRGETWHQVRPPGDAQPVGGEGAITAAPGGDVVGVSWDAATGDRLQAYKFEAATGRWRYAAVQLHHPLFSRPWIAAVPGPFALPDGTVAPYATVVRSDVLSDEHGVYYVSFDGLTYRPESDELAQVAGPYPVGYLEPKADPLGDVLQPHLASRIVPLARGGFLATEPSRKFWQCQATRYGTDGAWSCLKVPGLEYGARVRTDSRGWVHQVLQVGDGAFWYQVSPDGGRSWSFTRLTVPGPGVVEAAQPADLVANGVLGVSVLAVHVRYGTVSRDVVFRLDTSTREPRLVETMLVGAGDRLSGSDVTAANRFDYSSVALLPDGTVAVAFDDAGGDAPRLAIEVPEPAPTASPSESPSPSASATASATASASPSPSEPSPTPSSTPSESPSPTPAPSATPTPTPTTTPPPPGDTTAPAASAVLPVRLTDPAVVRFDEPVTGVTPSNVALRLASGPAVPATMTCRNGASPAACDAVVTRVELRPVAPFRPGERYAVAVGGTPPRDAAGNAAIPATFAFRASTVEDQGSPAAAYAWRTVADPAALGGSHAVERRAGARATYAFTGTSVTWYGATGPDQGRVQVLVDGVDRGTVDTYSATPRRRVARTVGGLSPGAHTLTLRVAGTRSSGSSGTNVVVDEVRAGTVAAPVWSWSGAAGSALSGGSAVIGDLAGAQVTFTFRGTGVDWVTSLTPDAGRAAVYVDGRLHATYDNYAATRRHGVRRSVVGLPDGVHRVTVRVLGTRSSRSAGTLVTVDGWLVR